MNVEIQRSDGRVHAAVISALKPDTRMVDVEWFEAVSSLNLFHSFILCFQGETKGKVVDLATLFRLNPKLAGLINQNVKISQKPEPDRKAMRKTMMPPTAINQTAAFQKPLPPKKESANNGVNHEKFLSTAPPPPAALPSNNERKTHRQTRAPVDNGKVNLNSKFRLSPEFIHDFQRKSSLFLLQCLHRLHLRKFNLRLRRNIKS
jgi:hypothetical protein